MNICLGGTFDPLHKGHRRLLDIAVGLVGDGKIYVGLTSDNLARGSRNGQRIRGYEEREKDIREYLENSGVEHTIVEINDGNGIAHKEPSFDAIVVSRETYSVALSINQVRKENEIPPLLVIVADFVTNDQGEVIKGRRIRKGEMDAEGNRLGEG
jgi:pantetheine-phosphate adenylyltransferase